VTRLGIPAATAQQQRLALAERRVGRALAVVDALLAAPHTQETSDALLDVRLALTTDPAGPTGTPERTPHA
jgi:hypothetical protein